VVLGVSSPAGGRAGPPPPPAIRASRESIDEPANRSRAQRSRENGAKSRGPITPEGKRRSAQNATTHGLYAKSTLIRGENPAAFKEVFLAFYNDLVPVGGVEIELVHDLADAAWRKRRYRRVEAELFEEAFAARDSYDSPIDEPSILGGRIGRAMRDASQFAARAVREFRGALSELRGIRRDRDRSAALAAKRMYAGQEGVVDSWARPVPITQEQQMSAYVFLDPDAYRDPSEGARDWIAGGSPAPVSSDSDGDGAMHDWIAGGAPAPGQCEGPRERANTEEGAMRTA
jgi:hypothetical protein